MAALISGLAHPPDIIALTETQLTSRMHRSLLGLRRSLPDYVFHLSSISPEGKTRVKGRAGVALLLHKGLVGPAGERVKLHGLNAETDAPLRGCVAHATLCLPGSPRIEIFGVYIPPGQPELRTSTYKYMRSKLHECTPNCTTKCTQKSTKGALALGDWNAALLPTDRHTDAGPGEGDGPHAAFVAATGLAPLGVLAPREHTYFYNHDGALRSSRIDDTMYRPAPGRASPGPAAESTFPLGGSADHLCLHHEIGMHCLGLRPPPAPPPTAACGPSLILPIPKSALKTAAERIRASLAVPINALRASVLTAKTAALAAAGGNLTASACAKACDTMDVRAAAEQAATTLNGLTQSAYDILLSIAPTKTHGAAGRSFLPNTQHIRLRALSRTTQVLKLLLAKCDEGMPPAPDDVPALVEAAFGRTYSPRAVEAMAREATRTATNAPQGAPWRPYVVETLKAKRHEARLILTAQRKAAYTKQAQDFQRRLAARPGPTHRSIFKDTTLPHSGPPLATRDAQGEPTSDPATLLGNLETHFTGVFAPTGVVRTGLFLPGERQVGQWAWERPGAPDPYTLHSPAIAVREHAEPLSHLLDRAGYEECVKHLKRSKQAGPDKIPNELIQILPVEWHDTIHSLFALMWISGYTPNTWLESRTILLYKKRDPLDAANYRPIGLCCTLYKLWTANVTCVLSTYASATQMLSESQEGFRSGRNTKRQIRNLVNALEDAHHHKHDILGCYIDFSSAFNMVDGDSLLCLMYDLGFPADAVRVVAGIYAGATTTISVPAGTTAPIPIHRGTIQGDVLSPFLFSIYIEPLLRWLQAGGRGYRFGCLSPAENAQHNMAALGYADDTTMLVGGRPRPKIPGDDRSGAELALADLLVQVRKLELFAANTTCPSDPSAPGSGPGLGLPVNGPKCVLTGRLHASAPRGAASGRSQRPYAAERSLLMGKVKIAGTPVPFTAPDETTPFLGVPIAFTLAWGPAMNKAMEIVRTRGRQVQNSLASPAQALRLLRTAVKPAVAYLMSVAPFGPSDIDALDTYLARFTRTCWKQNKSTPTTAILARETEGGLGLESLRVEYAHETSASLTRALNDTGRLGLVTRALAKLALADLAGIAPDEARPCLLPYHTTPRQMSILVPAGMHVTIDGKPLTFTAPGTRSLGTLQAAARTSALADAIQDSTGLGPQISNLMLTLRELGVTCLGQLTNSTGTHLVDTLALSALYGTSVKPPHKRALNRISMLVSGKGPDGPIAPDQTRRYMKCTPLAAECRALPPLDGMVAEDRPTLRDPTAAGQAKTAGGAPPRQSPAQNAGPSCSTAVARTHVHYNPLSTTDGLPDRPPPGTTMELSRTTWLSRLRDARADPTSANLTRGCEGGLAFKHRVALALAGAPGEIPANVLLALHDDQSKIASICGGPLTSTTDAAALRKALKGRGPTPTHGERYWLVRYEDTIVDSTSLPHYAKLGFHTERTVPCRRWGRGPAKRLHLVIAVWKPFWEIESVVQEACGGEEAFSTLREAYKKGLEARSLAARAAKAAPPPPLDTNLTNAQKQGCWVDSAGYDPGRLRRLRSHVTLNPAPVDPELDITVPPGAKSHHILQVGRRIAGEGPPCCTDTAYIYTPSGAHVGSLPLARCAQLQGAHAYMQEHAPDRWRAARGGDFPDDLAALLRRHTPPRRTRGKSDAPLPPPPVWIPPPTLIGALAKTLGLTQERYASPVHHSLPIYWSTHPEDQAFGARLNSLAAPWVGGSIASPPQDTTATERCMRHAICSALACSDRDAPSLTVILAPLSQGQLAPFNKHPWVVQLCSVPARSLSGPTLERGTHMSSSGTPVFAPSEVPNPRSLALLVVANPAGHLAHLAGRETALATALQGALPFGTVVRVPDTWAARPETPAPNCPRALGRYLAARTPDMGPLRAPTPEMPDLAHSGAAACHTLSAEYPPTFRTEVHALGPEALYTDGSKQSDTQVGAAVWIPPQGRALLINPNGLGATNDINRAELSAIHAAVLHATEAELPAVTIYTDSQCSISWTARQINRPHTLSECKHADLLSNIVVALDARAALGWTTALVKVKAHTGVVGNEKADAAAKEAANVGPGYDGFYTVEASDNDPRSKGAWCTWTPPAPPKPPHKAPPKEGNPAQEEQPVEEQTTRTQSLANLTTAPKRAARASGACTNHKHPTGVYDGAWAAAVPTLDPECTAAWRTRLPFPSGRRIFRARWGLMPNNMLEHRYKRAPTPNCPLCGMHDGVGHILGRCEHPTLKSAYISRHNEALRQCTKTVLLGVGSTAYVVADAGRAELLPTGVHSTRLPAWLLPAAPETERCKMRPDLLIIHHCDEHGNLMASLPADKGGGPLKQITLLELGYCSDTKHAVKAVEKRAQHADLVERLEKDGWAVTYLVITLGNTGTVPSAVATALEEAGAPKDRIKPCIRKLCNHAMATALTIETTRHALAWARTGPGG